MKRNQIIKLIISFLGLVLAIILAYVYFIPTIDENIKEHEKLNLLNKQTDRNTMDSILTSIMADTSSKLYNQIDSLIQAKCQNNIIKND